MANNTNILLGFLGGVAAGIVGGVLLAPKPGRESMTDISNGARRWQGQLNDQWSRLITFGRRDLEAVQRRQDQFVEEAREGLDEMPHRPRNGVTL